MQNEKGEQTQKSSSKNTSKLRSKRSTSLNSMVQFLLLMLRPMNELTGSPGHTVKVRYMYHSCSQE